MPNKKEEKCLFCDVASKKLPSYLIHENDDYVAVLDINPVAKGHTLLIAKSHTLNYLFSEEKHSKGLQAFVKDIADFLKAKLDVDGITIMTNNFYGQDIPHLHWHIIPRFVNDKLSLPVDKKIKVEQVAEILAKNAQPKAKPKAAPKKKVQPKKATKKASKKKN